MVKPIHEYILIKPEDAKVQTESGLVIPTEEGKKTEIAEVLEVSDQVETIKKGDRILFKSYSTDEVVVDKESHIFIKLEDVIAIL